MSTPCAIGIELPDGKVKAVRCHWDGYVAGAGAVLGGWYTDAAKVEALLALGNLSEVKQELADCVAYHRDKGEQLIPARSFANVSEYRYTAKGDMDAQYLYLYKDGRWQVYGVYNEPDWLEISVTIGGN